MESFDTLYEAQLLLDNWRFEYITTGPTNHSATRPRPNTRAAGVLRGQKSNQNSHNDVTTKRVPSPEAWTSGAETNP
jgi:hypothetical protein